MPNSVYFIIKIHDRFLTFSYFALFMIGYIEGLLKEVTPTHTYIDIGGIGYEIHITLNTYQYINGKTSCKLFTHLKISEDAWTLYGFATEKEKAAFQQLLSVSGVGAATARILLSSLTADELGNIIWEGNSKALETVKGIGSKTAQRIILELKGKITQGTVSSENAPAQHNTNVADALNALLGLGINKSMAESALKKVKEQAANKDMDTEEWIKLALKNM